MSPLGAARTGLGSFCSLGILGKGFSGACGEPRPRCLGEDVTVFARGVSTPPKVTCLRSEGLGDRAEGLWEQPEGLGDRAEGLGDRLGCFWPCGSSYASGGGNTCPKRRVCVSVKSRSV